jgi:SAM-dependent methyltransferase
MGEATVIPGHRYNRGRWGRRWEAPGCTAVKGGPVRADAIEVEESRLVGIEDLGDYPWFKERHRIFPAVFEDRGHKRIIDLSAGVGCAAIRIKEQYNPDIVCNDITPTCLKVLRKSGLNTVSFSIDEPDAPFPYEDGSFDCVISMVTIEHLTNVDHFLKETYRILEPGGYFYISAPNYAAPEYALKLLISGRSFHDPLGPVEDRYEFFGHIRYFTYKTLRDYVASFGFALDTVYIARPEGSSRYLALYEKSKFKALSYRYIMSARHQLLPPRWASEPILCYQKAGPNGHKSRKVVL